MDEKIDALKKFLQSKPQVLLAFLFGYDAFDWIEFAEDYYRIMQNSCSIPPQLI